MTLRDEVDDGIESVVVDHHELPVRICQPHPDVFPDLYGDRSLPERARQTPQRPVPPTAIVEGANGEGRGVADAVREPAHETDGDVLLFVDWRLQRRVHVDGQDAEVVGGRL